MYSQFRAQYPTGSLTSELLHMQQGQYVVQATIQVGGVALATGLSAATTVEEAEDIARARALMLLGIESEQYASDAHLLAESELGRPAQLNPAKHDLLGAADPMSLSEQGAEQWSAAEPDRSQWLPQTEPEDVRLLATGNGADDAVTAGPKSKKRGNTNRGRRRAQGTGVAANASSKTTSPIDLSEIIAQTDVELRRLGWTSAQGREYLQQTYNKRSRQQLTDDELMEFLQTLQAQTLDQEPPF